MRRPRRKHASLSVAPRGEYRERRAARRFVEPKDDPDSIEAFKVSKPVLVLRKYLERTIGRRRYGLTRSLGFLAVRRSRATYGSKLKPAKTRVI